MPTPSKKALDTSVASESAVHQKDLVRANLRRKFEKEEKVQVTVPPFYAPYLGRSAMVSVQGIAVFIPANGRPYRINATHAAELHEAMRAVDIKIRKEQAMSNFQANLEKSPGELRLI